jgi:hypothetical protein
MWMGIRFVEKHHFPGVIDDDDVVPRRTRASRARYGLRVLSSILTARPRSSAVARQ